jgi:membrane protein
MPEWSGVGMLVSLVATTGLFALLFRFLPDVHLRWRDVTTGAFVTAVLFTIGQQLIGLYLGRGSMATSYGGFRERCLELGQVTAG